MSWQGRTGLALVYGAVLLAPLAWVLVTALEPEAGEAFSRATGRADLAGELATSIFLALLTTLFAVLIGLPLALLLNLRMFPCRGVVGSLYFLPLLIPPHIHTIAWTRVIGDKGWLRLWLEEMWGWSFDVRAAIGDPGTEAFLGHLYPGPAWIMACAYFPLVVLAVGAGLRSLDGEGIDAARLLGGRRAALRQVILPQVAPRLLAGAAFVFILALTTYPVVSLLDTPTLVHRVFSVMSQAHGNLAAASMVGLPLVIVAGAVIFGLGRIESRTGFRQRAGVAPAQRRAGVG
ncbi:MAG: ABC transporter permease subunit, partial [Planctomycetes bacterium]|nr:ABC transporter permease subunit [Planctomycetota bacterium]